MSFIEPVTQSGQVTSFRGAGGLLETLKTFITGDGNTPGRDWTVELNQAATNNVGSTADASSKEMIFSNTGTSGQENVIIGIREQVYAANQEYNWHLNGYLQVPPLWNSHAAGTHELDGYDSTSKAWTELPEFRLIDATFPYWFYSTQEFVIVAARVSTSWFQCYLGNMRRFGSPSEYPHPLVIAGCGSGGGSYQDGGAGPVRPGTSTKFAVGPDNTFYTGSGVKFEPMEGDTDNRAIIAAPSGAALLVPCFIRTSSMCLGYLQNMVVFRRTNATSESLHTDPVTSRKYRTFAQGETDYDYDYMGIFEELATTTTTTTT